MYLSEIKEIIKKQRLSNRQISIDLGYREEHISKILNEAVALSDKFIFKFTNKYVNSENESETVLPIYDVVATGSTKLMQVATTPTTDPIGYINVGGLMPKAEFVIKVSGNSMTPNYPSGCYIGIRQIRDGYFDYGSVYVIETEDNRFIKRVFKGKKDDHIQLYSDNDSMFTEGPRKGEYWYEPFQMPVTAIKRIFKVVGAAKSNDHSYIPK